MEKIPSSVRLAFGKNLENSFSTAPSLSERDSFPITTNGLDNEEIQSSDQWAGHNPRTTGGHELIKIDGKTWTRLYLGGTVNHEILDELSISEKDVMGFLAHIVLNHGEHIRLDEDFSLEQEGWQYHYECTSSNKKIPMWMGEEVIYYNNQQVFQHNFMIGPVEG